jgi:hypothetical protein
LLSWVKTAVRDEDLDFERREGDYGWRLIKGTGYAALALAASLVLNALGIPGVIYIALAALAALLLLVYVAPFLGPRRRPSRRSKNGSDLDPPTLKGS